MNKKIRIMLIDDNKIDLFINNQFISKMNIADTIADYQVAGEALQTLQTGVSSKWPHLILCDIHMPVMGGFKFLEEYAILPESLRKNCRIIMVSSSLDEGDRKKALASPLVLALLEKPINMAELRRVLENEKLI